MGRRILILGASGFIGNALYKELLSYFDVYGTYFRPNDFYEENQVFYRFDASKDDVDDILTRYSPMSSYRVWVVTLKIYIRYTVNYRHIQLLPLTAASFLSQRYMFLTGMINSRLTKRQNPSPFPRKVNMLSLLRNCLRNYHHKNMPFSGCHLF